jgi:DNA-binding Lrp family transcriptional regulator
MLPFFTVRARQKFGTGPQQMTHVPEIYKQSLRHGTGHACKPHAQAPAPSRAAPQGPICAGLAGEFEAMRAVFVMVKCEMGQAYRVAREMADSIPELSEMHSTSGQYDLLGKFYLEPDEDIGLFVVERIQSVPGVKDTYTLQTFNAFSGGKA